MTIPNLVTIARIFLIPCFAYLWLRGEYGLALIVFAVAGISDLLDGFLARVLDQRSRLGQILDPAADKLMMLAAFIVATAQRAVPLWLAALVIGRDLLLATGGALFAFVWKGKHDPEKWRPSRIGKYATFLQVLTIGLALIHRVSENETLRPFVGVFVIQTAAMTAISGVQYVSSGIRALGARVPA